MEEDAVWKDELLRILSAAVVFGNGHFERAHEMVKSHIPSRLYRYRSDSKFAEKEIESGRIWLSSADKFNDPYDCALSYEMWNRACDISFNNRCSNTIKHESGFGTMRLDFEWNLTDVSIDLFNDCIEAQQRKTRLACLSESDLSMLMWSHYANNHTGVCLVYNARELEADTRGMLYPVHYLSKIPVVPTELYFDDKSLRASSILTATVKARDWSYEREWRIVKEGTGEDSELEFARPAGIIMGSRMKKDRRLAYIEISRRLNIPIYQSKLGNRSFSLESLRADTGGKGVAHFDLSIGPFAKFNYSVTANCRYSGTRGGPESQPLLLPPPSVAADEASD